MSSDDLSEITPVDDGPSEADTTVDAALGDLVRCAYHDRWLRARLQIVEDHIRDLRSVVEAAIVWRQCERAMHGNTAEESRRHYEAVWTAKRRLHELLDELLVKAQQAEVRREQ